ncbi:hypothetical protein JZ751_022764 [Albula glossodonta]|uniref:Ig-like domain-containing protein n=1 Tax=Albula glossodonta TaxID=121402 RepID=A0A8T2PDV5_9TELE|nr:hypothetical protein JZ751_022764 [Albula glossodonta]
MPQRNINVVHGKMVVLQAWYPPTSSSDISKNTVIWNLVTNFSTLIISHLAGDTSQGSSQFTKRVGFTDSMPSTNVSIYINNTKESDSGRYLCQVIIPGGKGLTQELTLNVIVPPSPPVCKLVGKPVLKGNVTMSCKSKSGKPVPIYKWTKTSPGTEVFFSPMLNENLGTLKLSNLTKNMSGKYVCKSSNTAGTESCIINLDINTSTNVGVIAGATVGSVVGFMALVLVLIFFLRRKSDTEDDMANDIKEDAQAPKRVSWAKSGTGSIISKNGTLSSITTSPNPRDYRYPNHPGSDTASIITAAGSTMGYRPRPGGEPNTLQSLPGYNTNPTLPRSPPGPASTNGSSLHRPEQAPQPQAPKPPPLPTNVTSSNISRMGGVPIMVPAQNQAGSLV